MQYLRYAFFSSVILLSGCAGSLLPAPEPAPQQWLLEPIAVTPANTSASTQNLAKQPIYLSIERPQSSTPLRSTQMWYRNQQHQLMPFSSNEWAESLDVQLQQGLSLFFAQQAWVSASLTDQPGYKSAYRLGLGLHEWYLDAAQKELSIALQVNLFSAQGVSLWQNTWQTKIALPNASVPAMVSASQEWLDKWASELNELLIQEFDKGFE